jgi:hypothetical protein
MLLNRGLATLAGAVLVMSALATAVMAAVAWFDRLFRGVSR